MNDYMTLLHKHKINGGFLAPDRIPMEERNKNEMILELQNEVHTKDKEIKRLNNIINEFKKLIENEINESKLEEDYDRVDALEYCLATLKELKGSDK